MRLVPIFMLYSPLVLNFLCDGFVYDQAWMWTVVLDEVPPRIDPGGIDNVIGQAAVVFNLNAVVALELAVNRVFFFSLLH